MPQKAGQQGRIAGIYVVRDCSFSGRGGIENLAILEDFDLLLSLHTWHESGCPQRISKKFWVGLQVAFELQEVLILISWRGAVDCIETLLSMCVTNVLVHIWVFVFFFFFLCVYLGVYGWGVSGLKSWWRGRMVMRGFLEAWTGIA